LNLSRRVVVFVELLTLTYAVSALAAVQTAPNPANRCHVPMALLAASAPLPNTTRAIRRHRPLLIVALGSSSTAGFGASKPAATYPAVLQRELTSALGLPVRVLNRGVNGEIVAKTAARISRDVLPLHPMLVIWQAGTNDFLHSNLSSPHQFETTLADGVGELHQAGIDVILMDLQYFPRGEKRPAMNRYLDAIDQVGELYHADVIHRHRIMSYWVASGEMSVDDMLYRDHFHMSDRGYQCLGKAVADFILHKAQQQPDAEPTLAVPPPGL